MGLDMNDDCRVNPESDAIIAIHVQRDFCPGGALPVPHGDEIVPVLNEWLGIDKLLKIGTRDWHPANHCSFKAQGGPWPPHCVQGSSGAEFHADLNSRAFDAIISQATNPEKEAYSSFDETELADLLRSHNIRRLWMGGLATEYCVRATALDGRKHGFEVFVIEDAIRGIEVNPGDCEKAKREMEEAGVRLVPSDRARNE